MPKHEGGTDDPGNVVLLTVQEHAEAHRELYEKNGKIEDYSKKLKFLYAGYIFIESIRDKIIPTL